MIRAAAPVLLALALAACGDKAASNGDERKTAAGEVLGGSISDDMLPLDTVTSQSPPLRERTATSGSGDADDPANAPPVDSDEGPGAPPTEDAPAPEPTE